jgi:non-heme chloroperoxidase
MEAEHAHKVVPGRHRIFVYVRLARRRTAAVAKAEDLKQFDVPTLILHGDDDQIVPIADSALLSSNIVKGATLKVYKGAPHGMCTTLKDQVNKDLLTFSKG